MQQRMTIVNAATACRRSAPNGMLSNKIDRLLARMCDFRLYDHTGLLSCAEISDQHGTSALFLLELVEEGVAGLTGAMIWEERSRQCVTLAFKACVRGRRKSAISS